jgi:hypothetical protein
MISFHTQLVLCLSSCGNANFMLVKRFQAKPTFTQKFQVFFFIFFSPTEQKDDVMRRRKRD